MSVFLWLNRKNENIRGFYCFPVIIHYAFCMNEQEETIEQNTATKNSLAFQAAPFQKGVSPKIAILHDAFLYRGGGERLVTLMAKYLHADLISGFFSMGSFDPRELGFTGRMISLGKPVFMR